MSRSIHSLPTDITQSQQPLRIALLHPDLGIGGAERLVVDAAVALRGYGHTVHMFTSHHSDDHCFAETNQKNPDCLPVWVAGDWLPNTILGRFAIICAMLRGIWLSLWFLWHWTEYNPLIRRNRANPQSVKNEKSLGHYDVIITDQLSIYNLFLTCTSARTIFYCHFPDLLLSKPESSPILQTIKTLYRLPVNLFEQITTGLAELVLVNSQFTAHTFAKTFRLLDSRDIKPQVLYPSIAMQDYDSNEEYDTYVQSWWKWYYQQELHKNENNNQNDEPINPFNKSTTDINNDTTPIDSLPNTTALFVSINRFERKKDIAQAIYALLNLRNQLSQPDTQATLLRARQQSLEQVKNDQFPSHLAFTDNKLLISGGYDSSVQENVSYYNQLVDIATELSFKTSNYPDMSGDIVFLRSFSNAQRAALLRRCQAVVYTPENEHFGIVPVESMYSSRPVIAHVSGGPLESVLHEKTGYLCQKHPIPTLLADKYPMLPSTIESITTPEQLKAAPVFGEAYLSLLTSPTNATMIMNRTSHQHAIDRFGFVAFGAQWEAAARRVMAMNASEQLWLRTFMDNFGASPRSKIFMFGNMTITVICVMIWSRFRTWKGFADLATTPQPITTQP